jgi:HSP20 family protein
MSVRITKSENNPETPQRHYPASPFRTFEDFFNAWARQYQAKPKESWQPMVDVMADDSNLILDIELPGVDEKDIDLKFEGGVLTVKGEKKLPEGTIENDYHRIESFYGNFSRAFTLPDTVDTELISAKFKDGVLRIMLPARPETRPRSIRVNA